MPFLRSIALALLVAIAPPARGAEPPIPLQYNLALDIAITGALGASIVLLAVYQPELLPESCRWCTPPGIDVDVRNALVWKDGARTADVLSTVALAAIPASAMTYLLFSANSRGDVNAGLVDSLLVTEATAAALLVNQVVKLLVGRKRPHVFFKNDLGYAESEDNLSFYGGHTSFAFSVTAATVTVAAMRGYAGVGIVAGRRVHPVGRGRLSPDRGRPALPDRHPRRRSRGRPRRMGRPSHLPLPQPDAVDRGRTADASRRIDARFLNP